MLYEYMKKESSKDKSVKVNLNGATKALRPQLYKYLLSVSHKIDGRSYQRFGKSLRTATSQN